MAGALLGAALLHGQGNPGDDRIYNQVRIKLAESPDVNGGGIEVTVQDGAVTLRGKVMKQRQKDKATKVARKVRGVKTVDNQLVVETRGK